MSADTTLNHFTALRFRDGWWELDRQERRRFLEEAGRALRDALPRVEFYRVFPTRHEADLLIWSALAADEPAAVREGLSALGDALSPWRSHARPTATLWGLTRPSPYTRRASSRTIDPLTGDRRPALVIYPFSKTTEWHLLDASARQELMGEHIRVGREFPEIDQLLLYSYGLQDQEFVVVYEMDDIARFSELVATLRATEVRRYTLRDTPVWTALHIAPDAVSSTW